MYYCYKRIREQKVTSSPGESIVEQLVEEIEHQSQGLDPGSSSGRFFCFRKEDSYSLLDRKAMSFGVLCDGQMHHFLGVVWNLGPLFISTYV